MSDYIEDCAICGEGIFGYDDMRVYLDHSGRYEAVHLACGIDSCCMPCETCGVFEELPEDATEEEERHAESEALMECRHCMVVRPFTMAAVHELAYSMMTNGRGRVTGARRAVERLREGIRRSSAPYDWPYRDWVKLAENIVRTVEDGDTQDALEKFRKFCIETSNECLIEAYGPRIARFLATNARVGEGPS